MVVVMLILAVVAIGGLAALSRNTSLSASKASAPLIEEEVSAPPEVIAEPHSQPGGEPSPAVESPAFIPLNLRQARDANGPVGEVLTLGGLFEEPLVERLPQGTAYGLSKESAFLESESATSERSNWLMLEVGQANVRRVYLLLNLTNSNVALPGGGSLDGQGIGQVVLFFEGGASYPARLIAGVNIRDWIVDLPGGVDRRAEDDAQIEVLRNTSRGWLARVDQVRVDVPEEYWGLVLESIVVEDWSLRDFGMKDPAILWFGGALEVGE